MGGRAAAKRPTCCGVLGSKTASEWTTANPERLSADEGEFVAASIAARDAARARERRNTRRLHRLVVGRERGSRCRARRGRDRGRPTQRSDRPTKPSAIAERARQRAPRSRPPRRHAPQRSDEWPSRPGHSPTSNPLAGSAPRARGRSAAPGRRHLGFPRGRAPREAGAPPFGVHDPVAEHRLQP